MVVLIDTNVIIDFIVTRNIADFSESKVPAIEPETLLKIISRK